MAIGTRTNCERCNRRRSRSPSHDKRFATAADLAAAFALAEPVYGAKPALS